jgi:hypothetical protein
MVNIKDIRTLRLAKQHLSFDIALLLSSFKKIFRREWDILGHGPVLVLAIDTLDRPLWRLRTGSRTLLLFYDKSRPFNPMKQHHSAVKQLAASSCARAFGLFFSLSQTHTDRLLHRKPTSGPQPLQRCLQFDGYLLCGLDIVQAQEKPERHVEVRFVRAKIGIDPPVQA